MIHATRQNDLTNKRRRFYAITYDPAAGWDTGSTDPVGHSGGFPVQYGTGSPPVVDLLGGRRLEQSHDAGGDLESVRPPAKPEQGILWDTANRLPEYAPA